MSIKTRLSRAAEERLLRLAYNKRISFLFGAEYTHIHESDFDRFMAEQQGVKVMYDNAEVDGTLVLAEDRVVTSIEGIPLYDTEYRELSDTAEPSVMLFEISVAGYPSDDDLEWMRQFLLDTEAGARA